MSDAEFRSFMGDNPEFRDFPASVSTLDDPNENNRLDPRPLDRRPDDLLRAPVKARTGQLDIRAQQRAQEKEDRRIARLQQQEKIRAVGGTPTPPRKRTAPASSTERYSGGENEPARGTPSIPITPAQQQTLASLFIPMQDTPAPAAASTSAQPAPATANPPPVPPRRNDNERTFSTAETDREQAPVPPPRAGAPAQAPEPANQEPIQRRNPPPQLENSTSIDQPDDGAPDASTAARIAAFRNELLSGSATTQPLEGFTGLYGDGMVFYFLKNIQMAIHNRDEQMDTKNHNQRN